MWGWQQPCGNPNVQRLVPSACFPQRFPLHRPGRAEYDSVNRSLGDSIQWSGVGENWPIIAFISKFDVGRSMFDVNRFSWSRASTQDSHQNNEIEAIGRDLHIKIKKAVNGHRNQSAEGTHG